MLDTIQGLSNMGMSSIGGINSPQGCKCDSNSNIFNSKSNMFDGVLISLLNAIKEKNKSAANESGIMTLESMVNNFNEVNLSTENLNIDERIENAIQL